MTLQEYFDQTIQGNNPDAQNINPLFVFALYRNHDHNKLVGEDWVGPTRAWAEALGLNTEVLDDVS